MSFSNGTRHLRVMRRANARQSLVKFFRKLFPPFFAARLRGRSFFVNNSISGKKLLVRIVHCVRYYVQKKRTCVQRMARNFVYKQKIVHFRVS